MDLLEELSTKMAALNIRELTEYDGDAVWFLLRKFRLTASVMENIMATLFKFYVAYTDSPQQWVNNMRILLRYRHF